MTTSDPMTRPVGTAASHDFDRLLAEAIHIARRIADELADASSPLGSTGAMWATWPRR